jgi:putative oxidoreductase
LARHQILVKIVDVREAVISAKSTRRFSGSSPMATSVTSTESSETSAAAPLDRAAPYVLSLLRIMAALLFLQHGLSKFFGFPSANAPHPALFNLEWFAALIETAGSVLVALGLCTRAAALIMSGEMAIGYFMFHAPQGFYPYLNHGEAAILYCFIFLYLVFAGAGPLSLDALLWRKAPA